jgi:hypothetical protein
MSQLSIRTAHMDWVCSTKSFLYSLGVFGEGTNLISKPNEIQSPILLAPIWLNKILEVNNLD